MPAQGKINGKTTWTEERREPIAAGLFPVQGSVASLEEVKLSSTTGEPEFKPTLRIEEIYLAPEVGSAELTSAMRLLPEALQWTESAVDAIDTGNLIQSDDAMLHVQSLMPALFCCRRLGEGFAAVVNAIMSSFDNCGGVPMEKPQLEVIRQALFAVRSEPGLSFERAFGHISAMEDAGLKVSPVGTDEIAEWLSE